MPRNKNTNSKERNKHMEISKFKLVVKYLFGGGVSGVVEYVLDILKNYLSSLSDTTKGKIQSALNLALKVISVLEAVKILIPTKWQTAYGRTIAAVNSTASALADLELTKDELDTIIDDLSAAIDAWKSPDDETCA